MRETPGISARSSRNSTSNPARPVRRHSSELSEFRRTNPPVNPAPEVTYRVHAVARGAFCVRAELADSRSRARREIDESREIRGIVMKIEKG